MQRLGQHTVCGGVIQVEMCLLDALAMVTLRVAQAEQPFFEKIIFLVPESKSNVLQPVSIGDACYAILAPSICS